MKRLPTAAALRSGRATSAPTFNSVLALIETAAPQGATILCGGKRPSAAALAKGWFVEPTVIADVQPHFTCFQEEIFGPCVTILPFSDEAHALQLANDSRFGLGAAV